MYDDLVNCDGGSKSSHELYLRSELLAFHTGKAGIIPDVSEGSHSSRSAYLLDLKFALGFASLTHTNGCELLIDVGLICE